AVCGGGRRSGGRPRGRRGRGGTEREFLFTPPVGPRVVAATDHLVFPPPCRTVSHTHALTEDATRAGAVCSREAKTRRQAHHCWTPTIPSIQLPAWVSMTRLRINITKTITPAAPKQYQE